MFKLPLTYALRNLWRRKWRVAMTSFGVAIVIFASVLMTGLSIGIKERVDVTGEEENLLLISSKGTNMMISSIEEDQLSHLVSVEGLATSITGEPMISPEVYDICRVAHVNSPEEFKPVFVRGVSSIGYEVHHSVTMEEGRIPEYEGELAVGRSLWVKLGVPKEEIAIGKKLILEKQEWDICGIFSDNGSVLESEIWCNVYELQNLRRRWSPTCVFMRFKTPEEAQKILPTFMQSGVFSYYFKAIPEKQYYQEAVGALDWIHGVTVFMSIAVSLVGLLIGINTMYANIVSRKKEIATYRVLGFRKLDIVGVFLSESLVMCGVGAFFGLLFGMLTDGYPLSTGQGAFFVVVNATVLGIGLLLAMIIAVLGVLIPLHRTLKRDILENMR